MHQIIITGKPGVGKTTLLNALKDRGFKTISCDTIVNNLYQFAHPGYQIIKTHWEGKYTNQKGVDKKKLWNALNNQEIVIEDLNKLIHPLINNELQRKQFDFCECPIIGSEFLNKDKFKIIKLVVSDEIAIARIIKSKKISYDHAVKVVNLFRDNVKTNATFNTSNEIGETFVQKVINYCQSL